MNDLKISIVTPTLNQGEFIEKAILSVLNQRYANFEHIIIDGGSTDNTIDVLKAYPHLIWKSENDGGQSEAINKGFRYATGDIVAWLNSDDYYEENIFGMVANYFVRQKNCQFLYGDITYIDMQGSKLYQITGSEINYKNLLKNPDLVRQPSSFWRMSVIEEVGYLNEKLNLVMDYDYFLRIAKRYEMHYLNTNLSYFRHYSEGKTSKYKWRQLKEIIKVLIKEEKGAILKPRRCLARKLFELIWVQ